MNESHKNKPSLRIDWFDGTIVEDTRPNVASPTQSERFVDEAVPETTYQKKPIGFKKLLDFSVQSPTVLSLELANKNSFWLLLNRELRGDFIVLIVKILAKLYSITDIEKPSMIKTILQNKVETSIFLKSLQNYLMELPYVRVVDKRVNMHFWNDPEPFYMDVLKLLKGISSNGKKNSNVLEMLGFLETSINGVMEEHMEKFSDELFTQINILKSKFLSTVNEDIHCQTTPPTSASRPQHLKDYKNLSIFPSKEDLIDKNLIKIKPNIVNGAYKNVEEYLDLQFKLLREDCFGPLREGICKYLENPLKNKYENIRVHSEVRILRTYVSQNKVGHLVDIAWKERFTREPVNFKKTEYNKQLMFGSLLLLTLDQFETILCATVLDSSSLREGYIVVSFHNPVSKRIFNETFLMVESEVFFEPYHRVLKVLQDYDEAELPMKKYIVDVQPDTSPPAYLSASTLYTLSETINKNEKSFEVLSTDDWPGIESLGFDYSQIEAYKFALTREFAVIQGPPGTGKTYIGVRIATTLLRNLSLEGTPMLIICYTNHALDQFLERILKVTTNIVRLGSQSKSETLKPYTLGNMRTRMKCKYSYLYEQKKHEVECVYKEMLDLQTEIEKCENEIVRFKIIEPYLKIDLEIKSYGEDPIIVWLFDDSSDFIKCKKHARETEEQEILENATCVDKIETCFSEHRVMEEISMLQDTVKYIQETKNEQIDSKATDKFKEKICKLYNRLEILRKYISMDTVDEKIYSDVSNIPIEQRWKIYLQAAKNLKKDLMFKMNGLMERYNTCIRELDEVSTLIDSEVMKNARVVGVTTTVAARRRDLLQRLSSPILIVEEAAEVFEAHIVASLTPHCQHLILIGDHKQLRPTAAHYILAKQYNLEISLFERMIRNGVHARTLSVQRRMRPEFAQLLVPAVYERLDNHPDVCKYPDIRGMAYNLYFLTHSYHEDSEGFHDSTSYRNNYEANWCISLAQYLLRMSYLPEDITILTTYTGQATLIKELKKPYSQLNNIKVTVVDNYQGEENKIVLLSLVRSNEEGKIGFLTTTNRICVSLSRAKEGFYIFGNMNILRKASKLWQHIDNKLSEMNAIGASLKLRCETHRGNILEINTTEQLDRSFSGTCLRNC